MAGETMSVQTTVTIDGLTPQARTVALTANQKIGSEVSVPAAKIGSLTTRSSDTAGTLTMNSGHGFVTGDVIDVFWSGGSIRGMTATVTGDSVAVTGGTGDALPAASTAITAMLPAEYDFVFTGNNAVSALAYSNLGQDPSTTDYNAYVIFTQSDDTLVTSFELTNSLPSNSWDGSDVATNPFAGVTVSKVKYSHGNTSARTLGAYVFYN